MKDAKDKRSVRAKLQETRQRPIGDEDSQRLDPRVKTAFAIGIAVLAVWVSGYIFRAFAGAIRGFKDLRQSIKE